VVFIIYFCVKLKSLSLSQKGSFMGQFNYLLDKA
jgi:hypothetical protein